MDHATTSTSSPRRHPRRRTSSRPSRSGWTCRTARRIRCSTSRAAAGKNGEYTYPDDAKDPYHGGPAKNVWTVDQRRHADRDRGPRAPRRAARRPLAATRRRRRAHDQGQAGHDRHREPVLVGRALLRAGRPGVVGRHDVGARPTTGASQVHKGDKLSVTATYETKLASWYEGMGIMVVWMAYGHAGTDPFTTSVNAPGILTHGHLARERQPRRPDARHRALRRRDQAAVADGARRLRDRHHQLRVRQRRHEHRDVGARPSSRASRSRSTTSTHRSATGSGTRSPTAPNRATATPGIAYPLANGSIVFDSGELGTGGAPASGHVTWSTPTTLPPGTYTYWCRIHPFMRGAFRVVAELTTCAARSSSSSARSSSSWWARSRSSRGTCSPTTRPRSRSSSVSQPTGAGGPATPDRYVARRARAGGVRRLPHQGALRRRGAQARRGRAARPRSTGR